jgi:hypothetical protein
VSAPVLEAKARDPVLEENDEAVEEADANGAATTTTTTIPTNAIRRAMILRRRRVALEAPRIRIILANPHVTMCLHHERHHGRRSTITEFTFKDPDAG